MPARRSDSRSAYQLGCDSKLSIHVTKRCGFVDTPITAKLVDDAAGLRHSNRHIRRLSGGVSSPMTEDICI